MAECLGDARKAAGCELCWIQPGGKQPGRRKCTLKIHGNAANYMDRRRERRQQPELREKEREWKRKSYYNHRAMGLCTVCGRDSGGASRCGACAFDLSLNDMCRVRI